jgi:hypothetical protein
VGNTDRNNRGGKYDIEPFHQIPSPCTIQV